MLIGGTSLIDSAVTTLINSYASSIVPTILAILTIIIPIGLSCWAIGLGIGKAIQFLQKKASHAMDIEADNFHYERDDNGF